MEEEQFEVLKVLFTISGVDLNHDHLNGTKVSTETLAKCVKLCVEEHKRTGFNYSDVFDYLREAIKFAKSIENIKEKF